MFNSIFDMPVMYGMDLSIKAVRTRKKRKAARGMSKQIVTIVMTEEEMKDTFVEAFTKILGE